jgi:ribonuclease J
MTKKDKRISIIQLGGKGVVGNNLILIEYEDEILVLDAGIMFPTEKTPGVDLIIPDLTYLKENKDKVKALVLSHGHEDHIGAIPYLISEMKIPIYGTQLTIEFVKNKLEDHNLLSKTELNIVKPRDKIKSSNFEIEFINVNHSIPDAVAISISTPTGKLLYTGDFKIDQTPINDEVTDFYKLAELGEEGLLALLSDSTNAERSGYTNSESTIGKTLENKFSEATGRIIIATFSSHIHRIQQIVTAAKKTNRKLVVNGRSMLNAIEIAQKLNYIDLPKNMLIEIRKINNLDPEELVILMTGSQGEPRASLTRIARGEHRHIDIIPGDTVFLSATAIPGNELAVSNTINKLLEKKAEVIYGNELDVHVSGHACQEELKLMLNLTKPKYFIPVHGEYRHLYHHARLAKDLDLPEKNIFVIPNGVRLEISPEEAKVTDKVTAGKTLIDGLSMGDMSNSVLSDRNTLGQNGIILVQITINKKTGKIITGPDIISRGFIYMENSNELLKEIESKTHEILKQTSKKEINNHSKLKRKIKNNLNNFLYQKLKRTPMIVPLITKA